MTSKPSLFRRFFGTPDTPGDRRKRERSTPAAGVRILIIDDSRTIVAVLSKMLTQSGYQVVSAGDAEAGVQMALMDPPELILLDIVLPGMNGFAALRVLRRETATRNTPIIMMSGNMQATEQFYAQKQGADDFLKKPFPRAELFHKIERLLAADRRPSTMLPADDQPAQVVSDAVETEPTAPVAQPVAPSL